jgi:hypothetical protein
MFIFPFFINTRFFQCVCIIELPEFSSEVFGFGPRVKILKPFFQPNPWRPIFVEKEPPNTKIALRLMQWTIPSGRLQRFYLNDCDTAFINTNLAQIKK